MSDEIVEAKAEVVEPGEALERRRPLTPQQRKMEELRRIEDSIVQTSMRVVQHSMDFAEIDPDDTEPPEHWVQEMGEEEALRRFRLAKAGWESAKTSPVGIKVATQVMTAGMKIRAAEKTPARSLSVNLITIAVTDGQFEEIEVGDGYDDA